MILVFEKSMSHLIYLLQNITFDSLGKHEQKYCFFIECSFRLALLFLTRLKNLDIDYSHLLSHIL